MVSIHDQHTSEPIQRTISNLGGIHYGQVKSNQTHGATAKFDSLKDFLIVWREICWWIGQIALTHGFWSISCDFEFQNANMN
jgi:hypothetical protein